MEIKIGLSHIEVTNCDTLHLLKDGVKAVANSCDIIIMTEEKTAYIQDRYDKLYKILYYITNTFCEDIERIY